MSCRADFFVELPETIKCKVMHSLAKQRSRLGYRVFKSLTRKSSGFPYRSTMDLIIDAESPNIGYIAKTLINPCLASEGYMLMPVVPEKAIIDSYGDKSRQRYWGFIEL